MRKPLDVVIIGAGQAGLAMSYHLTQQGREHVVLEQARIGEAWRSQRWDSFTLVTPNFTLRLPSFAYAGQDPEGFLPREEIWAYLERYAASFGAPVRAGVRVASLAREPSGRCILKTTSYGLYEARNVVVATGSFHRPVRPPFAAHVPADIRQLDATEYRNPQALPPGAVLVIGSGQAGAQIAEELLYEGGRTVYLAVGSAVRVPWRYHLRA